MKKVKEALFFVFPILLLAICGFISHILVSFDRYSMFYGRQPSFMDIMHYMKLFAKDDLFATALINTLFKPFVISIAFVLLYALIVFIMRKKIKVPRLAFYIIGAAIGSIVSLAQMVYIQIVHCGPSIVSLTMPLIFYSRPPSFLEVLNTTTILFALLIGVFLAFLLWFLELLYRRVKKNEKD